MNPIFLTIVVGIILVLMVSVNASKQNYRLNCNPNKIAQYKYKSIVKAFGNEKKGEKFIIRAKVNLACVEAVKREDDRDVMNYIMTIPKASMVVKNTTSVVKTRKDTIKKHVKGKSGDLSSYFTKPIHMIITSNGKVEGVVHEKDEPEWVTNMKKSIINKIQTKFSNSERMEKDGNGEHQVHYVKRFNKANKRLTISKSYTDKDLGKHRFEPGHSHLKMDKQMVMDSNTKTVVDTTTGQIVEIEAVAHYDLGAQREPTHHGIFHDNQNVPFTDEFGTHDAFKMQHKTSLKLIRMKKQKSHKRQKWGVELMDDASWRVAPNHVRDSSVEKMQNKPHRFSILSKKKAKAFIQKLDVEKMTALEVDQLKHILKRYKSLTKDALKRATKTEQGAALKRFIHILGKKYKALLAEKDAVVLNDNIIALLSARQWASSAILAKLQTMADSHDDDQVRTNAYLVLAEGASRVASTKRGRRIGKYCLERLMNDEENMQLNIHAIENAGMAIDIKYIERLIETMPKKLREAAIATLRKRTDGDKIMARILLNTKRFSNADRSTLLQMLARRHPNTDPKQLDEILAILFANPKVDPVVKQLAFKFMLRRRQQNGKHFQLASDTFALLDVKKLFNGLKDGARRCIRSIKTKLKKLSDDFEVPDEPVILRHLDGKMRRRPNKALTDFSLRRTIRRIRRAARRVGRTVRRVARRVGGAVRRVVNTVTDAARRAIRKVNDFKSSLTSMFSKAAFKGNQVCIQASKTSGDRMCIYDAKLINFVRQQGDLSSMAYARHRVWETLVGSNKVHLYLGVASYMGTNMDCSGQDFRFALFAKGMARAVAFTKEIDVVDGHIYVRKNPSLGSEIFLRVFGSVVYRNTPIPNNVQTCKDFTKNLLNKRYDNLPGYKFHILIGPIPVSFGFTITSGVRVDAGAGYCLNRLNVYAQLTTTVDLAVVASAKIDIVILNAGIEVKGGFEYSLIPKAEIVGVECKACIKLDSVSRYSLGIDASAQVNIVVYKKKWNWNLFTLSSPRKTSTLANKCVYLPRGRTLGDVADNNLVTSQSTA